MPSPLTLLSFYSKAIQCPDHSHFTDCLPSCQPSCFDPDGRCEGTSSEVPSACKEGCICQPGYVLGNDKCVLKIECDCKDAHGTLIPVSELGNQDGRGRLLVDPTDVKSGDSEAKCKYLQQEVRLSPEN